MDRAARVIAAETAVVREQFRRNMVGWLPGDAVLRGRPHGADRAAPTSRSAPSGSSSRSGTRPARPDTVAFDDRTIIDSDGLLKLERRVPRTMTVVGAGVIGVEYASMFGALGTKVTVVDQRDRDARLPRRRDRRGVPVPPAPPQRHVPAARAGRRDRVASTGARGSSSRSGKEIVSRDRALRGRAPGRDGRPRDRAHRPRGRQARADQGRRRLPHLRAAHLRGRRRRRRRTGGDRDGAGPDRRAARVRAAGRSRCPSSIPTGVYAIPEIGMVGCTEEELTDSLAALRGRDRALDGARPRADDRRRGRDAQAARLTRTSAACSACT